MCANGDGRREAGDVADDGGRVAGIRRVPVEDRPRDPRRGPRAGLGVDLTDPEVALRVEEVAAVADAAAVVGRVLEGRLGEAPEEGLAGAAPLAHAHGDAVTGGYLGPAREAVAAQ